MRRILPHMLAFAVAIVACWGVALWALDRVERQALDDIGFVLTGAGHDWPRSTSTGFRSRYRAPLRMKRRALPP